MGNNGHTVKLLLAAAMLPVLCGCSTRTPEQTSDKKKPESDLTITFRDDAAGGCSATVDPLKASGRRSEWVYWGVNNSGCSTFNLDMVTLEFDDNVVKTKEARPVNGTATIAARISPDPKDAPDGAHMYSVYLNDKKAGDPEIDVAGDCPGCEPH
jgi:hypothetical protein